MRNLSLGFPTRCNKKHTVKPQNMVRGLKIQIKKVEGLYYQWVCSKNKDTDQLCDHQAADLCLELIYHKDPKLSTDRPWQTVLHVQSVIQCMSNCFNWIIKMK